MTRLFRDFQYHVTMWMTRCFGTPPINKEHWVQERCDRFIEEALELAQACGYDAERVATLTQYVFNRPVGKKEQEVGGVMVTLAALCAALPVNLVEVAFDELFRISDPDIMQRIRDKQASKNDLHYGAAMPAATIDEIERAMMICGFVTDTTSPYIAYGYLNNFRQLYELGLQRKLDASSTNANANANALIAQLKNVLNSIKVRAHFIDMPSETMWNAGTPENPSWVPDWREEIGLIEQALHGTPLPVLTRGDTLSRWQVKQHTLPSAWLDATGAPHGNVSDEQLITAFRNAIAICEERSGLNDAISDQRTDHFNNDPAVAAFVEKAASVIWGKPFPTGVALAKTRQVADLALDMLVPKGFIIDGLNVEQLARKLIETGDGIPMLQELCQQQGYTLRLDPSQQPHMRLCSGKFASGIWTHNADGTVSYEQLAYKKFPAWVLESDTFKNFLQRPSITPQQQSVIDYFVDHVPDFIYQVLFRGSWQDVPEHLYWAADQRRVVLVVPAP
jgi:hypothetical protein